MQYTSVLLLCMNTSVLVRQNANSSGAIVCTHCAVVGKRWRTVTLGGTCVLLLLLLLLLLMPLLLPAPLPLLLTSLLLLLLLLLLAVNKMTLLLSVLDEVVDGMSISFAGVSAATMV